MRVALRDAGAKVGRGLAAGQLTPHRVGPGIAHLGRAHLRIEGGLGGIVNGGELRKAVVWAMGHQLGHNFGVRRVLRISTKDGGRQRVIPALVAHPLECGRCHALAAVAAEHGARLRNPRPQRGVVDRRRRIPCMLSQPRCSIVKGLPVPGTV